MCTPMIQNTSVLCHPPPPFLKANVVTLWKHWPFINCFCPDWMILPNAQGSNDLVQSGTDGKIYVSVSWTNMTQISEWQTWGSASYTVGLKIIVTIYMENNGKCVFHHTNHLFLQCHIVVNCPNVSLICKIHTLKWSTVHFIHNNFLVEKCRKLHE